MLKCLLTVTLTEFRVPGSKTIQSIKARKDLSN